MSNERRTLLEAAVAPGTPVSRRPGARHVLEDCWTPIRNAIEPRLADVLLEALGGVARADDEDVAKPAKLVLSRDRRFVQLFSDALHAEFRTAIADFVAHKSADARPAGKSGLSLIEYGDMEFTTLVESSSARIRNAVDDEYTSVKLRVSNLVREPELRDAENPFRPAIFLRAVHTALERVGVEAADLLRLTHCFDSPLIAPISGAYVAVDRQLAAQGVSSELLARNTIARPTISGGPNSVMGGMASGPLTRPAMTGINSALGPVTSGGYHFAPGVQAEQVLQALYQRLHLVQPMGGYPAVAPGGMPMGGVPAAGVPMSGVPMPGVPGAPAASGRLYAGAAGQGRYAPAPTVGGTSELARLAAGAMPLVPGAPGVIDANLVNAINEIQKLGALALGAVQAGRPAPDAAVDLNALRGKLTETASKQVDKLTIEIVGLLFDRINADKHVPDEIKSLLLRLQFPLIKVALTDPDLFASAHHPARQLIDRIASSSIGWTPKGDENQRYLAEVQTVVRSVLTNTDATLDVYDGALKQFETYLADERTRDDDPVTRAKRALAEAETREVMAINATIQIRSAFEGVQLESYLREFLIETWVRVLVAASLAHRNDEAASQALVRKYLGIVPDLVWSVQPKINPDDRKRLVKVIPPVLTTLREGLQTIEWPLPRMQEFFRKLMSSHAQAVKALELAHGTGGGFSFEPSTLRIKLDGLKFSYDPAAQADEPVRQVSDDVVKQVLAQNHAEVEHLELPREALAPVTEPGAAEVAPVSDSDIEHWRKGDWFELTVGDVTERVRLRWISPRKSLYLFTPADGTLAHSLAPETLRAYVRAGRLRPVETQPLFERAVNAVMHDLQAAEPAPQPPPRDAGGRGGGSRSRPF
jgi:hypothetical protein